MARRYKVTLRKNGAVCGEAVYATKGEALSAAANMQGAASGLEAIVSQIEDIRAKANRRRNPSIGRGTKHRDIVAEAIAKKLRAEGVKKAEATSRGFAIATAAEKRRRNPTPIDIASLDFSHFKKVTKIDGFYNVRSGRRFARVMSKDESFVTDVPVTDGGGPTPHKVKGADAIKRRAYEQLRIHIQPTRWKPSVRVNPGTGRVPYKGAVIKIESGTYTVEPHGATFSGPDGFVSAKKWIEKNT